MVIGSRESTGRRLAADILVRDQDGWLVAAVEVKNALNLNPTVAAGFRRNLLLHDFVDERVPFFVLVSQDDGYVWDQRQAKAPDDPSTVTFSMRPVVHHYVPWLTPDGRLSGTSLEFVVGSWLSDLAAGIAPPLPEVIEPLSAVGLLGALNGAVVSFSDFA